MNYLLTLDALKITRALKIICFSIILFQLHGQSSVVNTAFASTNLAAPVFNQTVTNSETPISGSSETDCMKAFSSSAPDGTIKLYSRSSECGLVNKPHSAGHWLAKFRISGNNQQTIL